MLSICVLPTPLAWLCTRPLTWFSPTYVSSLDGWLGRVLVTHCSAWRKKVSHGDWIKWQQKSPAKPLYLYCWDSLLCATPLVPSLGLSSIHAYVSNPKAACLPYMPACLTEWLVRHVPTTTYCILMLMNMEDCPRPLSASTCPVTGWLQSER